MPITARTAARHEALTLRLEALLGQVAAIAARRPGRAVDAATRALAGDLLHRCAPFCRGRGRPGALPPAAPHHGGLAAQLAEARARLAAFELRHAGWEPALGCIAWRTADRGALPVARLQPRPLAVAGPGRDDDHIRARLRRRIDALYDEGYDDAEAGRPRRGDGAGLSPGSG